MERVLQQMILQLLQKMISLPNRKAQLTVVGVFPLPPAFLGTEVYYEELGNRY